MSAEACTNCNQLYLDRQSLDSAGCPHCSLCLTCCSCIRCDQCGLWTPSRAYRHGEHTLRNGGTYQADSTASEDTLCSCTLCRACCRCFRCGSCNERYDGRDVTACEECTLCHDGCCSCIDCQQHGPHPECSLCADCSACCSCADCTRCNELTRGDYICANCGMCQDGTLPCCRCFRCVWCGERSSNVCSGCDRCGGCGCACDEEHDPAPRPRYRASSHSLFFEQRIKFHPVRRGCPDNPSTRLVALEIECSSIDQHDPLVDTVRRWGGSIVPDGTTGRYGFEINTAPAAGDKLVAQLRDIAAALTAGGAQVTATCGLHVHIDCRDVYSYDLRRIVLLYAHLEPALFAMQPASRLGSRWCKAVNGHYLDNGLPTTYRPKESKARLIGNIYYPGAFSGTDEKTRKARRSFAGYRTSKYLDSRYFSLNLHSYWYRRTVECRLHSATVARRKLIGWAVLWASIVDTALRTPERQLPPVNASMAQRCESLLRIAPTGPVMDYVAERLNRHGKRHGVPAGL